jgi:TetR/AcrR family fatty acid metabolism transcriptional regulator
MTPRSEEQNEQLREQRKAQLMQAAQRVFAREGFHAATISAVAAEAGVSQGTVYHYFDSKESLLLAVFTQWCQDNLRGEIEQALQAEPGAAGKLALIAHAATARVTSSLQLLEASVEFWSHIPRNTEIRKGFKQMFEVITADLTGVIQQGIETGEFRAIDANVTARLLIAVYDGLVLQWLADKKGIDWDLCTSTLITLVLSGLSTGTNSTA